MNEMVEGMDSDRNLHTAGVPKWYVARRGVVEFWEVTVSVMLVLDVRNTYGPVIFLVRSGDVLFW